jgi:hypothetical protein
MVNLPGGAVRTSALLTRAGDYPSICSGSSGIQRMTMTIRWSPQLGKQNGPKFMCVCAWLLCCRFLTFQFAADVTSILVVLILGFLKHPKIK